MEKITSMQNIKRNFLMHTENIIQDTLQQLSNIVDVPKKNNSPLINQNV